MRQWLGGVAAVGLVVGLAACSAREDAADAPQTYDVEESIAPPSVQSEASRAPGIVPTVAPGVAFAYRYGFRLPDANISAAQEAHAASCEQLGLARCRITGMTYQLDDRDRVYGTLRLSIDPLLARGFGKDAIAEVAKQDGRLRYAEITGEDQNPALDDAARRQGSANQRIAQLEADLAKATKENERVQLREQIRQLRDEIEAAKSQATEAEAKVQRTPMTFDYRGGGASGRGFAGENPATEAWYLFVDSLATMVSVGLKFLAVTLPWLALLLLAVLGFRSRWGRKIRQWISGRIEQVPEV